MAIGSFQALQHRMADMVVATEQANSMALMAAAKADSRDAAERAHAVSAAKAYIGQQARFVGQQAIQLHGGMGITDEMMVSHLFKRLTLIEIQLRRHRPSFRARERSVASRWALPSHPHCEMIRACAPPHRRVGSWA